MKLRNSIVLPILCSLAATILAFLVLFAGKNPNFMEDAHIIMLNTSSLGKNLIPTATSGGGNNPTATSDGCGIGGVFGKLCASATSAVAGAATDAADAVGDAIADKLAAKLGLKEFYSLHVLNSCEGNFSPNATAPDAGYNVTNCSEPLQTAQYNITAKFDHELEVGPLKINLAALGFSKDLQDEFDKIPRLLMALAVIYMVATGLTGMSFLGSVAALGASNSSRTHAVNVSNLWLAALATLLLLVGSLTTTVGARQAANKIDNLGEKFGLRAATGAKFLRLTWAAVGAMVLASLYWGWRFVQSRKERGPAFSRRTSQTYTDKP